MNRKRCCDYCSIRLSLTIRVPPLVPGPRAGRWPGATGIDPAGRRGPAYTLIFSHEFARCFWRTGRNQLHVPATTYPRINAHGQVVQVTRKPFTPAPIKPDVWKLSSAPEAAAETHRYLCRFLPAQDQTWVEEHGAESVRRSLRGHRAKQWEPGLL